MDNISIAGAKIYYTIPGINYPVTQTVVNAWIAMIIIVGVCIWLTRGLKVHATTKRQTVAEMAVQMAQNLVRGSMGEGWDVHCRNPEYVGCQLVHEPDRCIFADQ